MAIYLDYNASTPVDPEVVEIMIPFLRDHHGNPSSVHSFGRPLKQAMDVARANLAALLECRPEEIVFTSGASESNNTVIKGLAVSLREKGRHIITTQMEHPSILNSCRFLEKQGFEVTYVPVDRYGMVDPDSVQRSIKRETILISVMHANNELGTVQPLEEISAIAHRNGILFHTDAAQSIGKIPVSIRHTGADLLSIAGHKFYAPKGIGALYVRHGVSVEPLIHGAGQESNARSGTQNAAFIAGLGKAAEILLRDPSPSYRKMKTLREYFKEGLLSALPDAFVVNGHPQQFLPNTLHVSFRNVTGVDLLAKTPEIAASTGAACHSGQVYLSDTLKAVRMNPELAPGSIRFSIGRFTTTDELERAVTLIAQAYR